MKLAVLNPGGRDAEQLFPGGPGAPGDPAPHPPVNCHAYAACTGGGFFRDTERVPAGWPVLLVLRRDLRACLGALRRLKARDRKVAVTLKESGLHQMAQVLGRAGNMDLFRQICALADGCISSTPDLVPMYEAAGGRRVRFIPAPYPLEDARWDFARPLAERAGIFIGTREWDTPTRRHLEAVTIVASLGAPVTVVNEDGRAGRRRLEAIGRFEVVEGRRPYVDYLRLIARHRILFQLDTSAVPGQVAGDSLLCRVPCIGGDGAIERLAYPALCGHGRSTVELRDIATRLLADDAAHARAAAQADAAARAQAGYEVVSAALRQWFQAE